MENKKLAFHLLSDDEQFKEFFTEAKEQGVERGLHLRTEVNIHKELLKNLEKAKKQGYFPIGVILDGFNLEILFQRHPKQEEKHRFLEAKVDNDNNKM
jgi:hypothetical protein